MKTLEEAKRLVPTKYKPLNDTIEVVIDVLGAHPIKYRTRTDRYEYSLKQERLPIEYRRMKLIKEVVRRCICIWLYRINDDEMWLKIAGDKEGDERRINLD